MYRLGGRRRRTLGSYGTGWPRQHLPHHDPGLTDLGILSDRSDPGLPNSTEGGAMSETPPDMKEESVARLEFGIRSGDAG